MSGYEAWPDVCDGCGEPGPRIWCQDCWQHYHVECMKKHNCLEPEEEGYYDSKNHWVAK